MIKFWRKIRQQLIEKKDFRRYLIYAVGEVLLVMIGILLALQVNNWNEQHKKNKQEIAYLESFKKDLEQDIWNLNNNLSISKDVLQSINFLLEYTEEDLPWHDSLKYHFGKTTGFWDAQIKLNTYMAISTDDWGIISNDELRNDISNYYAMMTGNWKKNRMRYEDALMESSESVLKTRFNAFWESNYEEWRKKIDLNNDFIDRSDLRGWMIPNDFEKLKKDAEYLYALRSIRNKHQFFREMADEVALIKARQLVQAIEGELANL